jgi:hypothetical protein
MDEVKNSLEAKFLNKYKKTQIEINKLVRERTIFSKEDLNYIKKLQEDT